MTSATAHTRITTPSSRCFFNSALPYQPGQTRVVVTRYVPFQGSLLPTAFSIPCLQHPVNGTFGLSSAQVAKRGKRETGSSLCS